MAAYLKREIQSLLDPISETQFFERHWDRALLHVPGHSGKFNDIYDVDGWRILRNFREVKATSKDRNGIQQQVPLEPSQIKAAYAAGMTICADVSADPKIDAFLTAFQNQLRLAGGAPFAKLYASAEGGGFALHTDAHHVFVLQIEGRKQWRLSKQPAVASPLNGFHLNEVGVPVFNPPHHDEPVLAPDGLPLASPDIDALETVVLEEGDCLYVPPGTWHTAEALGHSIAVSISPPRAPVFGLLMRAIEDLLMQNPAWRKDVLARIGETQAPGVIYESVERIFSARLSDLRETLARLDPRIVHRIWRLNVLTSSHRGQDAGGVSGDADCASTVQRTDMLTRVPDAIDFLVAPSPVGTGDLIFWYHDGAEGALPTKALSFMTELAKNREFRAESALSWDPSLNWQAVQAVLTQLVAAGVLRALDSHV